MAQSLNIPSTDSLEAWRKATNTPALGIAIIEEGKVSHLDIVGFSRKNQPAKVDDVFNTASLAKGVTSYLALQLVDEGKLDLDETLYTYWLDPDVADNPYSKQLTARHILTHTSGFPNWRFMNDDGKLSFKFEPGTQIGYSGEGFEWLKLAIENKLDTPFEELVDSYIFNKADMSNSFMVWENEADTARIAYAHNQKWDEYPIVKLEEPSAADDLHTTVADLAGFGVYLMNPNNLSEELYHQLNTPQQEARPGINFSYGWIVFEDLPGGESALFNAGSDAGVNALIVLLPKSKSGFVAFTNGDSGRPLVMRMIPEILGETGMGIVSRF